jgi:O-antigen ligase
MSVTSAEVGVSGQNVADLVREVSKGTTGRRRESGFSLTTATGAEKFIAPFLGLYLGWAVVRVPEVFTFLAVPRLPMVLLAVFMLLLAVAVPAHGWREVWKVSLPLQCVVFLFALSLITTPLGIWMSGSIEFIQTRYIIAVVIFLASLLFLRDRRALRSAVRIYVLCTLAVAIYSLVTYDPNPVFFDDAGNVLDASEVSINRLRINVGISLDSNDWGAVLATTIPMALWLGFGSFWRRIFWGSIALVLAAAVVPTASRGSLLGLIAGALVLVTVGATGWKRGFMLVLVVGGGAIFSLIATEGQIGRFLEFGGDDYNVAGNEGRLYFWRQGIVWMIKRPWGYGIGNFPTYFGWLNGPDRAAHSSWIQYAMELGVAGISAFVLLTYTLVKRLRQQRRAAMSLVGRRGEQAEAEATLAGHVLAMLAATLVTGSFLSNAYYPLMYMALGFAAATLLGFPLGQADTGPEQTPSASLASGRHRMQRTTPRV